MSKAIAVSLTTRVDLDAQSHITLDWSVQGYNFQEARWLLTARARLWRSHELRSGVRIGAAPLGNEQDVEATAADLEAGLHLLVHEAVRKCKAAAPPKEDP